MNKTKFIQLEMFSSKENKTDTYLQTNHGFIKHYERAILTIIFILLASIISYCLGFNRGKKIALLNINQTNTLIKTKEISTPSTLEDFKKEKIELPSTKEQFDNKNNKINYTIQVATYKTSDYAQKEANKLKKNGFDTMIISKDKYILLCVGKFLNRHEAEIVLAKLKKRYEDCFIRRF
ncbi:MAG: SPOR domain-containing protein [Candidatus Omnitrophica bacterium]|nr:SPOR domain-containing protein [Candidatus Omnitrophota bacterium]